MTALLAEIRAKLEAGLVPMDGSWVTPDERNRRLALRDRHARWRVAQAGAAIAACAVLALLTFAVLVALAY